MISKKHMSFAAILAATVLLMSSMSWARAAATSGEKKHVVATPAQSDSSDHWIVDSIIQAVMTILVNIN